MIHTSSASTKSLPILQGSSELYPWQDEHVNNFLRNLEDRQSMPQLQTIQEFVDFINFTKNILDSLDKLCFSLEDFLPNSSFIRQGLEQVVDLNSHSVSTAVLIRQERIIDQLTQSYHKLSSRFTELSNNLTVFLENCINQMLDKDGYFQADENGHLPPPYRINNPVKATLGPLGIIIYLDSSDYNSNPLISKFHSAGTVSTATRLFFEDLPPELNGRIMLINLNDDTGLRSQQEIENTVKHEELHVLFDIGFSRSPFLTSPFLVNMLNRSPQPFDQALNHNLATLLEQSMLDRSWSEIVSHGATQTLNFRQIHKGFLPDYRVPSCFGAHIWESHLSSLREFHQKASGLNLSCFLDPYYQAVDSYYKRLREHQWIAQQVAAQTHLSINEIAAFLLAIPQGQEQALCELALNSPKHLITEQMEESLNQVAQMFEIEVEQAIHHHPHDVLYRNLNLANFALVRGFPRNIHRGALEALNPHISCTRNVLSAQVSETLGHIRLRDRNDHLRLAA